MACVPRRENGPAGVQNLDLMAAALQFGDGLRRDAVLCLSLDYRAACAAMDAVNRRYRVAYASNSLAGLIAIARSGHAISVLTRTAVPFDLHVVSAGLPLLPTISIALESAPCCPD